MSLSALIRHEHDSFSVSRPPGLAIGARGKCETSCDSSQEVVHPDIEAARADCHRQPAAVGRKAESAIVAGCTRFSDLFPSSIKPEQARALGGIFSVVHQEAIS